MQKTKIEWCDYTINPVKGLCPVGCSYCYARAMYHRFKWDPQIRFDKSVRLELPRIKKPSRIFVGSTIDLFHKNISPFWIEDIFYWINKYPQHTFIFLTKCPENLIGFSPFPDNCWIGISACDFTMYGRGIFHLGQIEASVKLISFEPILSNITGNIGAYGPYTSEMMAQDFKSYTGINWIIIGQQTPVRSSTTPRVEWIQEIVQAADRADIPVFLKDNLGDLVYDAPSPDGLVIDGDLRQEYPKVPEKVR